MQLLPLFLNLSGRRVVLVGDDRAAGKREMLAAAGADVRLVRPDAFDDRDLDDAWFVVSFAPPEVNARVARAAEARRIFVNAVDDPPNASAYLGGVIRRDGVTVAISTDGQAPALAGLLREGLDALLPADLDRWMESARSIRARWKADGTPIEARRPQLLDALVDLYAEAGLPPSPRVPPHAEGSSEAGKACATGGGTQ